MIRAVMDDARQTLREMPGFAAVVAVTVALGFGMRAAIFYEADGEALRLVADRSEQGETGEEKDLINRMGSRLGSQQTPGFTVIIGLSHYNLELSVPVHGVDLLLNDSRPDVAQVIETRDTRAAA
jgi:hypothetical protein